MNHRTLPRLLACLSALGLDALAQPAVPLIAHDPFLSVWSMSDRLADDWPKHWTGATMGMAGMFRIDGRTVRWCGVLPKEAPACEQVNRRIMPTSTTYVFRAEGVEFEATFASPSGPGDNLARLSRTASSVVIDARSIDGSTHDVEVYLDLTGEWCTHAPGERVRWTRHRAGNLEVVCMGSDEQPVLQNAGDWRRIDWGRVFLGVEGGPARGEAAVAGHELARGHFIAHGRVPDRDDLRMPRPADDDWPVLAASLPLGRVGPQPGTRAQFAIAFDPDRAIEFFGRPLEPLWKHVERDTIADLLADTHNRFAAGPIESPSSARLIAEATRVGGKDYAELVSLAYRQVLAGHAIVADWDSTPLMFSKENTSNGCIATIDVIYPASPFYLYHDPEMLKASLRPLLEYAGSARWPFPFAPHDLGTYPKANGQVYGGGETSEHNQMPVEESGNMLIMLAALARVEGNAEFARPHMPMLGRWAAYLEQHGLDPAHQLCTDDFAGHLARNANLSAKATIALGAYAQLLEAVGEPENAARWRGTAKQFASRWLDLSDGPEVSVLAFDAPGTWSQKYNLAWDRALALDLFPPETFEREAAWYRRHLGTFGLPLDSRMTYTKLDWSVWSACLTRRRSDFDAIMQPTYAWMHASPPPSRVPLSDWFETTDGRTRGMHSRTVVGGIWMPLLLDKLNAGWTDAQP